MEDLLSQYSVPDEKQMLLFTYVRSRVTFNV